MTHPLPLTGEEPEAGQVKDLAESHGVKLAVTESPDSQHVFSSTFSLTFGDGKKRKRPDSVGLMTSLAQLQL